MASFPTFAVACGEEGSDPLVAHDGRVVRVDEFAASRHLEPAQQDADLAAVAGLGVRVWRYGMPWRLTETAPGVYDWTLWDRALAACARHGLEPVVDLCHFGLPDHYPGFCDAAWVEGFVRYVDAFLKRYREPRWFTPVNEPNITALLSALLGWWNDRRTSREDWAAALSHCILANLEAMARVRADRDGWFVGAEGFSCPPLGSDDQAQRELFQTGWDLQFGLPLQAGVASAFAGVDERVLTRIAALATTENTIAGHDFYPTSVSLGGAPAPQLSIAARVAAYEAEARRWHRRYGVDFWVAETSNLSLPVAQQEEWLAALMAGVERLRADRLPVRGVCWYSRGDQFDWDTALREPVGRITEVGLFDTQRRARAVAAAYASLARSQG